MKYILPIAVLLIIGIAAYPQRQICPPGMVCPLPAYPTSVSIPTIPVSASNSHWTYPGEIKQHLLSEHGVDASGMSHEEALNLHASLHESRYSTYVSTSNPSVVSYGSTGTSYASVSSVSYGSTGSTVAYRVGQPVRNVGRFFANRQPVRSVLRRAFCR